MGDIGSLIVRIGADASGLQKAFDQLGGSANEFQQGLSNLAKIGATAFLAVATSMTAMTLVAGQQAEAITQLSFVTGINTDTLQEYDVLLGRVGLDGSDLTVVMRTLSKNMEDAKNGIGNAADRFRQLGIDITKVTGTDDLIRKIANSISTFASGTEKAAIMADLLGKSGLKFIPAFEGGAAAIREAAAASDLLGASLSSGQLAELGNMDDRVDDLAIAWKRFGQQLGSFVAPAIDFAARALSNLLSMASHGLKDLNALGTVITPTDERKKPPPLIDTSKLATQAQALVDAQLKANEGLFKSEDALAKANLANYLATLEAAKSAGIRTDEEVSLAKQAALAQMDAFTLESLSRQLANYQTFSADKMKLFTDDAKGHADRAKFAVEASQKEKDLINQIAVAQVAADTTRIQSGQAVMEATKKQRLQPLEDEIALATADFNLQKAFYAAAPMMIGAADAARKKGLQLLEVEATRQAQIIEQTIKDETRKTMLLIALDGEMQAKRMAIVQQFPTFFEKQMQDVVASNAFSVAQIISTWTGGLANAIVNGGDFVKAAWQSTQLAIVQGVLNTGVQLAAQWALQASVELGILTATEAAKLGLKTATNAAIVAGDAAAAAGTVGIWGGAAIAISGWYATTLAGFEAVTASMVGTVIAVGTFIEGVLGAIASALTATVFGIPWAGAIVVGIALIAAALAATGNLGFEEGGIGDFGSGMQAMLHGPEAIIPLNARGAAFMRDAMGGGGGGREIVINVPVNIDGRQVAFATARHQPAAWRREGASA